MPFMLHGPVFHKGVSYPRTAVLSDAFGAEIATEHPGITTRIPHDDDLCVKTLDQTDKCPHESHSWYVAPAETSKATPAVAASSAALDKGSSN